MPSHCNFCFRSDWCVFLEMILDMFSFRLVHDPYSKMHFNLDCMWQMFLFWRDQGVLPEVREIILDHLVSKIHFHLWFAQNNRSFSSSRSSFVSYKFKSQSTFSWVLLSNSRPSYIRNPVPERTVIVTYEGQTLKQ